jgi:hypothetical protein
VLLSTFLPFLLLWFGTACPFLVLFASLSFFFGGSFALFWPSVSQGSAVSLSQCLSTVVTLISIYHFAIHNGLLDALHRAAAVQDIIEIEVLLVFQ